MALHTELDIYKTGYELFAKVTSMVKNMERSFKNLIGEEIVKETAKLLVLVYRANIAEDKVPHLTLLLERVKLVEVLLRLSWDMHQLSDRQFHSVTSITQSISRQAQGWKNHSSKRPYHGGQGRHD